MATIQDVAVKVGVSVATVSRVLNNKSYVSDETREKVLLAIKKLDYEPNLLGRNLRRMETKMVLVMLPSISNPFFAKIVKGIEDLGHENGYNVMLCNTEKDKIREDIYLNLLKNRLADGVIFMGSQIGKRELKKLGQNYSVVQCCECMDIDELSSVTIDNSKAAYEIVSHLIKLGHKEIGMISCKNSNLSTKQRESGYKQALEFAGLMFNKELIKFGNYGYDSGKKAANEFIAMAKVPTAIFSISDIMAIGAIRNIKEAGFNVPKDISVVGFDNINYSYMCEPELTTVSQRQYEQGCMAMKLLIRKIRGEQKEPEHVILEHEIIYRQSVSKNKFI